MKGLINIHLVYAEVLGLSDDFKHNVFDFEKKRKVAILVIIIHTELLVAKIKSCIPRAL